MALSLIACGSSDAAPSKQPTKAQARGQPAKTFTVAGVGLGMSATQVELTASKAGYRLIGTDAGPDWALESKMATTGDRLAFGEPRKGIDSQRFAKGSERLSVNYIAMPNGPVAHLVSYIAPPAVLEFKVAFAELTRRYGKRSFSNRQAAALWDIWCTGSPSTARECLGHAHMTVTNDRDGVSISVSDELVRSGRSGCLVRVLDNERRFETEGSASQR